jgi:hypothetical protein
MSLQGRLLAAFFFYPSSNPRWAKSAERLARGIRTYGSEFAAAVSSLRMKGLRQALIVQRGLVLDGRNQQDRRVRD